MKIPTRFRGLAGEMGWVTAGQVIAGLGLIALIRILTNHLEPSEYGTLALALTIPILAGQLAAGPLSAALLRLFSAARDTGDLRSFLTSMDRTVAQMVATLVVPLAVALIVGALARGDWVAVALPTSIYALLSSVEQAFDAVQNAQRNRRIVAWHLAFGAWSRVGLVILIFDLGDPSPAAAAWAYTLGGVCSLTSQWVFFSRLRRAVLATSDHRQSITWEPAIRRFARPFAIWGLATWIFLASDRYALSLFGSLADVGRYTALYQLTYSPVTMASAVVLQFIAPLLYGIAGDATDGPAVQRARAHATRATWMVVGATGVITGAALVFHDALDVVLGTDFESVSALAPGLLSAGGMVMAAQVASQSALIEIRAARLLPMKVTTALGGLAANVLGASIGGVAGVVAAMNAFGLAYLIWSLVLVGSAKD